MINKIEKDLYVLKREMKKNDKNKTPTVGKEVVALTASKIITVIITLITGMLLSRFASLKEYGTYSQLLLIVSLATSIFMLGLPNSINFFLARADNQKEERKFLSVYYTLSTMLSIIMGMVLVLALPLFEVYFKNNSIHNFAYFLAIFPWASVIASGVENIMVVYHRTEFLIKYRLINSLCFLLVIIASVVFEISFTGYIFIYLIVNCVFALFVYMYSGKLCGGFFVSFDKKLIKKIFVFSIPLGLASVVGTLDIEIDKLLIGWFLNTEQLAIYTNASKELPVTMVSASITAVLLPKMAKQLKLGEKMQAIELWKIATELAYIFMALFVAGIFVYADDILVFLYSEKYATGIGVFRIYTLSLIIRTTYFGIILNANGSTKKILACSVAALIINAFLNPVLYYCLGIIGPAVATLLSLTIIAGFQLWLTAGELKMRVKDIFPWMNCLNISLINLLFGIIFYVMKMLLPLQNYIYELGESIVLGVIWSIIYLLIMKKKIVCLWKRLNT